MHATWRLSSGWRNDLATLFPAALPGNKTLICPPGGRHTHITVITTDMGKGQTLSKCDSLSITRHLQVQKEDARKYKTLHYHINA